MYRYEGKYISMKVKYLYEDINTPPSSIWLGNFVLHVNNVFIRLAQVFNYTSLYTCYNSHINQLRPFGLQDNLRHMIGWVAYNVHCIKGFTIDTRVTFRIDWMYILFDVPWKVFHSYEHENILKCMWRDTGYRFMPLTK